VTEGVLLGNRSFGVYLQLLCSADSDVEKDALALSENAGLYLNSLDVCSRVGDLQEIVAVVHIYKSHETT